MYLPEQITSYSFSMPCLFTCLFLDKAQPCLLLPPATITTLSLFLWLLLVLPTCCRLSPISFPEQLLVILSFFHGTSYISPCLLCVCGGAVILLFSLLKKLLGQSSHVLFISEALQCQAQFLKHNKYSVIICLVELSSNKSKQLSLHCVLTK